MKEQFKNILSWIKNPDEIRLNLPFRRKLTVTAHILLLDILMALPFSGLTYLIHYYIVKLEEPLIDWHPLLLVSLMILVIPVIEELIFRFPLNYKRNYLVQLLNWITRKRYEKRWNSISKYFLYLMITAFGLIHLTNFNNKELIFYALSPIIVGSQLMGGVVLSYVRIKLGFIWSIIQHGAFNLFVLLIALMFYHNQSITNISNHDLTLRINELMYINKEDSYFRISSENNLIYKLEANDISLFRFVDSLQLAGPEPYDNLWIDVNMESKKGMTKSALLKILKKEIKFDK